MSFVDERKAFEIRFNTGWTTTPIKWESVPFDPPVDATGNPRPYVAFNLRRNEGSDITLGSDSRWYRWTGVVIIEIFIPENRGPNLLDTYAESIKNIWLTTPREFQYGNSGIIRPGVPYILYVGNISGWEKSNVNVPYRRDAQT